MSSNIQDDKQIAAVMALKLQNQTTGKYKVMQRLMLPVNIVIKINTNENIIFIFWTFRFSSTASLKKNLTGLIMDPYRTLNNLKELSRLKI